MAKSKSSPRVKPPATAEARRLDLAAAHAGWGVTIRYSMLRLASRTPLVIFLFGLADLARALS